MQVASENHLPQIMVEMAACLTARFQPLHATTINRVFLSAFLMINKAYHDESISNASYSKICGLDENDINDLEKRSVPAILRQNLK
jgi:hypothetical protein